MVPLSVNSVFGSDFLSDFRGKFELVASISVFGGACFNEILDCFCEMGDRGVNIRFLVDS